MGVLFRRRRPILRLAAGSVTAGIAYDVGRNRAEQDAVNEQAEATYSATLGRSAEAGPRGDVTAELERLARLHRSGALSDEEFARAKATVLGR